MPSTAFCLICNELCAKGLVTGTPLDYFKTSSGVQDSGDFLVIGSQLWSLFVLRHALQLTENQVCQQLAQFGGDLQPAEWFSVCATCNEALCSLYEAEVEVRRWEKKVAAIRDSLKDRVCTSCVGVNGNGRRKKATRGERGSRVAIRQAVVLNSPFRRQFCQDGSKSSKSNADSRVQKGDLEIDEEAYQLSPPLPVDDNNDEWQPSESFRRKTTKSPLKRKIKKAQLKRRVRLKRPAKALMMGNSYVRQFKCTQCPADFAFRPRLIVHQKLHESGDGVKCKVCGWLLRKSSIDKHMQGHGGIKAIHPDVAEFPYYCDHCPLIFIRKGYLLKHFYTFHNEASLFLQCSTCDSKLETKQLLQLHVEDRHPELVKREPENKEDAGVESVLLQCSFCPEAFPSKLRLDFHRAKVHRDSLYHCGVCNREVSSVMQGYSRYLAHMKLHSRTSRIEGEAAVTNTEEEQRPQIAPLLMVDANVVEKEDSRVHTPPTEVFMGDIEENLSPQIHSNNTPEATFETLAEEHVNLAATSIPHSIMDDDGYSKISRSPTTVKSQRRRKAREKVTPMTNALKKRKGKSKIKNTIPIKINSLHKDHVPSSPGKGMKRSRVFKKKYICDQCPAVYKVERSFIVHLKLHEIGAGVRCKVCGWLLRKSSMDPHMQTHGGVKAIHPSVAEVPYYCDHCPLIFIAKGYLLKHFQTFHAASAPLLKCSSCETEVETKQLLELHIEDKHPEVYRQQKAENGAESLKSLTNLIEEPLQCAYCPLKFPSQLKLDYHRAKVHRGSFLVCDVCGHKVRELYGYSGYLEHMRKHSKVKDIPCEFCSKLFVTKGALDVHRRQEHCKELGLEELRCEQCNYSFGSRQAQAIHMRDVHEGKKEYCCEHCGKAFQRERCLKQHILLHTAPPEQRYKKGPFFCEYCQAKFNVRQGLYYHLKREHSDKYLHRCEQCGMGYCTLNRLTLHKKSCAKISCNPDA